MNNHPSLLFMDLNYAFVKFLITYLLLIYPNVSNYGSELSLNFSSNNIEYSKEKIYLHFDKSQYNSGEDMWFKIYLVDADTHRPMSLSKIVYVDLIDPANKILDSKIIKIDEGCSEGDFQLPKDLIQGRYTVRAYTNYMRNFDSAYFFRKKINIYSNKFYKNLKEASLSKKIIKDKKKGLITKGKPDIQFFPEGGYLVEGFINEIGFKAVGIDGKGFDIKGILVDETGKKATRFHTSKYGLGSFSFVPNPDKIYRAKIRYKDIEFYYDIPLAQKKGVLMQVREYQGNYRINLLSSLKEGTKGLEIIGRKNGEIICRAKVSENKKKITIHISKATLENGIVQFTVINSNGIPLCERLIFVDKEWDKPKVIISSSKKEYGKRDLVELEISMSRPKMKTVMANVSMAITDVSVVTRDSLDLDIKSYLLLKSELKGKIEEPGYYFHSKDPRRKGILDLLMMTQGWRQFVWNKDTIADKQEKQYQLEEGFCFKGNVKKYFNSKKSESVSVSILIRNNELVKTEEMVTNDKGYFYFGDYDLTDSTQIIIQAKSIKTKKRKVQNVSGKSKMNYIFELDSLILPKVTTIPTISTRKEDNSLNQYIEKSRPTVNINSGYYNMDDHIQLKEVELTAEVGLEKYNSYIKNKQLYREPSQRLDFAELGKVMPGNLLQYLEGRIAGLSTKYMVKDNEGRAINGIVAYFNRNQTSNVPRLPLYLLNGMPTDAGVIMIIPTVEVLFIDVLRGTKAAIYGSAGANGVIAVYTKDGTIKQHYAPKIRKGIISFVHSGYSSTRKFYEPVYAIKNFENNNIDYRSTILWKPMIKLNEEGKALISFYTADIATTYRVVLEGITEEGIPITSEIFLNIE